MKIVFICGSLEPGRDGVGDYTRRFAGELIQLGHLAGAIALNDWYISEVIGGTQLSEFVEIPVLRLPSACSDVTKLHLASKWIANFDPGCISLQFVPFSFQSKGLPFRLANLLKQLGKGRRWHIMFHETWVGTEKPAIWKLRVISRVQKHLVNRIITLLNPAVIHTHLPVYQSALQAFGWPARQLPLFSNISSTTLRHGKDAGVLRIGCFSQVEPGKPILHFLSKLHEQTGGMGIEVEVVLIGGQVKRMKSFAETIERLKGFKNRVSYTGFLPSSALSRVIQNCSLGLTPVPRHGLGKSGTVAAFLTHGIPVAAPHVQPGYDASDVGFFSPTLRSSILLNPDLELLPFASECAQSASSQLDISQIAEIFLSDLQQTL